MTAQLAPLQRTDRLPSCGETCVTARVSFNPIGEHATPARWATWHDIAAHHDVWRDEEDVRQAAELRATAARIVVSGLLRIDLDACTVHVAGRSAHLTPTEWTMLEMLAQRVGRQVGKRELYARLRPGEAWIEPRWHRHDEGSAHALRVSVSRLRAKLMPCGNRILTRNGIGYSLLADEVTA